MEFWINSQKSQYIINKKKLIKQFKEFKKPYRVVINYDFKIKILF